MTLVDDEFRAERGFILSPFINPLRVVRYYELGLRGAMLPTSRLLGIMTKISDEPTGRVGPDGRFSKAVTPADRSKLGRRLRALGPHTGRRRRGPEVHRRQPRPGRAPRRHGRHRQGGGCAVADGRRTALRLRRQRPADLAGAAADTDYLCAGPAAGQAACGLKTVWTWWTLWTARPHCPPVHRLHSTPRPSCAIMPACCSVCPSLTRSRPCNEQAQEKNEGGTRRGRRTRRQLRKLLHRQRCTHPRRLRHPQRQSCPNAPPELGAPKPTPTTPR